MVRIDSRIINNFLQHSYAYMTGLNLLYCCYCLKFYSPASSCLGVAAVCSICSNLIQPPGGCHFINFSYQCRVRNRGNKFECGHKHIALFNLFFIISISKKKTNNQQPIHLYVIQKNTIVESFLAHTPKTTIYVLNALMRTILFDIQFICLVFVSTICFQLIHLPNGFASHSRGNTKYLSMYSELNGDKKEASFNSKTES